MKKLTVSLLFILLVLELYSSSLVNGKEYLSEEEAPRAVFPDADEIEKKVVESTPGLRDKIESLVGNPKPSIWEKDYKTFIARKNGKVVGYAVIVEEIGKHRPITFIVEVVPEGKVGDVAVMVYREPYGGEIGSKRFLKQYDGKNLKDPIETREDIVNISGATLSVRAANRAIKKALAIISVVYLNK